ncbi:MAG: hypothetical protein GY820_06500 [Gammaproteobacteria bacterium]|nr:hypothetical protein [Gammaproteobacteria bacterium]
MFEVKTETRPEVRYVLATLNGDRVTDGSFPQSRLKHAAIKEETKPTATVKEKTKPTTSSKPPTTIHRPITRSMTAYK